jgi:hypothetical protein
LFSITSTTSITYSVFREREVEADGHTCRANLSRRSKKRFEKRLTEQQRERESRERSEAIRKREKELDAEVEARPHRYQAVMEPFTCAVELGCIELIPYTL